MLLVRSPIIADGVASPFDSHLVPMFLFCIRQGFKGLFELIFNKCAEIHRNNHSLLLALIRASIDFKNYHILTTIITYIEESQIDLFGDDSTALHLVGHISNYDASCLKHLIRAGLPVDSRDKYGNTLMHKLFGKYLPSYETYFQTIDLLMSSG